jgi:hypothetical protein
MSELRPGDVTDDDAPGITVDRDEHSVGKLRPCIAAADHTRHAQLPRECGAVIE